MVMALRAARFHCVCRSADDWRVARSFQVFRAKRIQRCRCKLGQWNDPAAAWRLCVLVFGLTGGPQGDPKGTPSVPHWPEIARSLRAARLTLCCRPRDENVEETPHAT